MHAALVTAVPFGYTLLKSPTKPKAPVTVETLVRISVVTKASFKCFAKICDIDFVALSVLYDCVVIVNRHIRYFLCY